jgi:hypothetical protein
LNRAQKAFSFASFEPFRASLTQEDRQKYELSCADELKISVSQKVFGEVKQLLNEEAIDVASSKKTKGSFGLFPEALSIGHIKGRDQQLSREIGVVGICLPEYINLQTIMPLFVAKYLFDREMLKKIYVALPVGAYGIAGFPRAEQYKQVLGILSDLFSEEQLGEQIIVMPDYRLFQERGAISSIVSPRISDTMAKHKYPFNNLFSFTEVAGYGADIALPALVEQKPVLVVSDFMQYESIHAGMFAAHEVGQDMSALLLPMLSPHVQDGKMVSISHMNEEIENNQHDCLEINPVMLAGMLVMDEEEARETYVNAVGTGNIPSYILPRIKELQQNVLSHSPLSDKGIQTAEDKSMRILSSVRDVINEELEKRMTYTQKDARLIQGGFL